MFNDAEERLKHQELLKKVKKLNALDMQKRITDSLTEAGFQNTSFALSEKAAQTIITFTTYETKSDRQDYPAKKVIKKVIKKTLATTNWKFIETSIEVRMGIYSGRIRVLETEKAILEDIIKKNLK